MDSELTFKAIEFAVRAHSGQFRKGTKIPYIIHPLHVCRILIEAGCAEEVVIAGILHDTVEDTPVELSDIQNEFGKKVAEFVRMVSESDKSAPWEVRKQETIDHLQTAPLEIVLIDLADKLDNILSIRKGEQKQGANFWQRFNRPKEKQKWYYESLAAAFKRRNLNGPASELVRKFEKTVNDVFGD